jgi:hypothetical protein
MNLKLFQRGNMEYVCKENNVCVIDVSRRNQCQACRLKKCLEVKMNRDGNYFLVFCLRIVCYSYILLSLLFIIYRKTRLEFCL